MIVNAVSQCCVVYDSHSFFSASVTISNKYYEILNDCIELRSRFYLK